MILRSHQRISDNTLIYVDIDIKEDIILKHILLTSTGFTNKNLEKLFLENVGRPANEVRVIFIPTAAIDDESRSTIPECRKDLLDAGVPEANIVDYDLDRQMSQEEISTFDAVYFCGGSETHLIEAVNKAGFAEILKKAVNDGLFYIGVSAGSMIASSSVNDGLYFIPNALEPHCEENITPDGPLPCKDIPVNISDDQAVWITDDGACILS